MRRFTRWTGLLCLLTTVLASGPVVRGQAAGATDPTAVFKAIPADATALLVLRNLKEFDAHVLGVAQQLNLPMGPNGMVPGPLEWLQSNGLTEGLDENGSVGLAVMSCADCAAMSDLLERAVFLLPSTDTEKLMTSLNGTKDGDTWNVVFMGEQAVAAPKGGFIAIAKDPTALKAFNKAEGDGVIKNIAKDRLAQYAKVDLFGWVTPRGLSPQIVEEINNTVTGMMMMANPGQASAAEDTAEQINKLVKEVQEMSLGITLNAQVGLLLSGYGRAKPGTETAAKIAAMKPAEKSLLTGLPDEPVVLTFGVMGGNPDAEKDITKALDQLLDAETVGDAVSPEKLQELKKTIVNLFVSLDAGAISIARLPADSPDGMIGLAKVATVESTAKFMPQVRSLFDQVKEIAVNAAKKEQVPEEEIKAVVDAFQWKEAAETLADVKVDHLSVALDKLPDVSPEDITEVKSVIGQEGVLVRIAPVDATHVVVSFGGGSARFEKIVQTVKAGEAPLTGNAAIKKVANRLPAEGRLAEGYLNLDHLLSMVMDIAAKLGQPIPMPLALQNAAPLSMVVTKVDDAASQYDLLVPMELAESVKELAPMMMMMMGGMGGEPQMESDPLEPPPAPGGQLN